MLHKTIGSHLTSTCECFEYSHAEVCSEFRRISKYIPQNHTGLCLMTVVYYADHHGLGFVFERPRVQILAQIPPVPTAVAMVRLGFYKNVGITLQTGKRTFPSTSLPSVNKTLRKLFKERINYVLNAHNCSAAETNYSIH